MAIKQGKVKKLTPREVKLMRKAFQAGQLYTFVPKLLEEDELKFHNPSFNGWLKQSNFVRV